MQGAQGAQRVVDGVAALGAHQRGDTALGAGRLHVVGGQGAPQVRGVALQQLGDHVDLFEGGADRRVAREVGPYVNGPELRADAARAQPRNVGVQMAGLVGGDVTGVEVVADLFAQRPRQVVVAVDDGVFGEEFLARSSCSTAAYFPKPKESAPSTLLRSRLPFSVARSFSSCRNSFIRP